jgi:5S rRNA maturation endonuclease (ribonuclease M5)
MFIEELVIMDTELKNKILEHLEKLRGKTIIVEGKKDKAALESFGLKDIIVLKKGIFETCEEVCNKAEEVAMLTDLDSEGKKLYSRICENLTREGVKIDNAFREFLFRETELRQIEGLISYLEKLDN